MAPPRKRTPRTYLRADERREQLLAAAAEIVGKRGWDALGMIPLAEAAGVSRQLVYEHFENIETLHFQVTRYLYEGVFEAVKQALERHPEDLAAATRTGVRLMLELPRGARVALRDLSATPATRHHPVARLRARMRREVTDLWTEPIQRETGLDERRARALAWMMNMASWGLLDLVDDGTFTAEEAAEFFVAAATAVITALPRGE
jgi:AcrR family transcriptional regulator